MSIKVENRKYLDTLRMTDHELSVVVTEEMREAGVQRQFSRRRTNFMRMSVDVIQPGGTTGKYVVRSYDLSEGGVGFFTGNYVHASTRCRLGMTTVDGESVSIDGTIAHCRNIWGHIHFAGVQFDSPIDLSWFDDTIESESSRGDESQPNATGNQSGIFSTNENACGKKNNATPVEQALCVIDELRQMIVNDARPDEIRACLELVCLALNLDNFANDPQLNPETCDSTKEVQAGNHN